MPEERICIVAKTYPQPSRKYDELVCTAGITADGRWIRLYPVPFRKLMQDRQYSKFHWIQCDIERREADFRPESHKLTAPDAIEIVGEIVPDRDGTWAERRNLLLKNVYYNREHLVADAYSEKHTSLAMFKPGKMLDFQWEECEERTWKQDVLEDIKARSMQVDLFAGAQNPFEIVEKIPYKFYYRFEDDAGNVSRMRIIDWELGQLFRRYKDQGEDVAIEKVRMKYWDDFARTKDLFLVLGATLAFHAQGAPNPFLIIGVFPPKVEEQTRLL
jgi:hypothetical protein